MRVLERDVLVEVRADKCVPAGAVAEAVALVRGLAAHGGRHVCYAAVALGVDRDWPGRCRHHVEATLDASGLSIRGFAAGATPREALDELHRTLLLRLGSARERLGIPA
jgi:hypothetical protein